MRLRRDWILKFACPRCGAPPRRPCMSTFNYGEDDKGVDGKLGDKYSFHTERSERASTALRQRTD